MVDFDTSHVVQFSKRINKKGIDAAQFVEGAEIILGCPGTSKMSPERIPGFTKTVTEECGVKLVDKPEQMIGKIDGILIESVYGSVHFERAKPFLEAGIPMFIDKPFANSVRDAEAIAGLAAKKNVPLFSASSLRFALEVTAVQKAVDELGPPVAVDVYGCQGKNPHNPGWFNYGIHSVEMLVTLLGTGFRDVKYVAAGQGEHSTGTWKGERVGSVTIAPKADFGFTYVGEKKTRALTINSDFIYRELVKEIVQFFKSGKPPMAIDETVEIVRYIEAVNKAGAA
jgi:predicted dehydrogenase